MMIDFLALYSKYQDELYELADELRDIYFKMAKQRFKPAFGDTEGEMLYLAIRELKPEIVFEISPAAGWSTNYILGALTRNQKGVVHSFELLRKTNGQDTESVIRNNQNVHWDTNRLVVHLGDVVETIQSAPSTADFLLIDSCHEAWFAKWYIENVFPRISGAIFMQDIAFHDRLAHTPEARHVWNWIEANQVPINMLSKVEIVLEKDRVRSHLPVRRHYRTNSIFFQFPPNSKQSLPNFTESVDALIEKAIQNIKNNERRKADEKLNQGMVRISYDPMMANKYLYCISIAKCFRKLSMKNEAMRCLQRGLGYVIGEDEPHRYKAIAQFFLYCVRFSFFRAAWKSLFLVAAEPRSWRHVGCMIWEAGFRRFGKEPISH
ncbi:MAG: hypothetical protein COV74_03165 [Candidatus Omnitrophica bacterium CG11_big_fil_rev_8_21_14_0_20_45_26]|uniref:Uncharacterized protein n=1 Tax=Candidatus Abzuiibacterium crystallinum TaxID=1974748 RepID=A0A2H0LTM2_9BACT|nr:MAG: hypothetical protein COV74_03165 [Candidatus Omnitrophica bacterium CG11_big_fil_rev_8_21_14_0_20_45_26]PIW64675.1 MAG: hypothetical protein COW12_05190 [Candidatus Omnitrophica bacterium CG12_big_fil_rev_8_21_14_0_65_45_16]